MICFYYWVFFGNSTAFLVLFLFLRRKHPGTFSLSFKVTLVVNDRTGSKPRIQSKSTACFLSSEIINDLMCVNQGAQFEARNLCSLSSWSLSKPGLGIWTLSFGNRDFPAGIGSEVYMVRTFCGSPLPIPTWRKIHLWTRPWEQRQ